MNLLEKKIAILTAWYGPYPWYFPYFIHSCSFNPSVDFIMITDTKEIIENKPDNVIIIDMSMETLKELASQKIGFEVNIDYPYKLCDIKPAYGLIFEDYLKEYEFWGHADVDLVYGNIRGFITDELLEEYDIISSRHDYITGSFALFRNNSLINNLFRESKDYKQVFSSSEHYCFDECNFQFEYLNEGYSIFDVPAEVQSMTYVIKDAERKGIIKPFFDFMIVEGTPGRIKFNNGILTYRDTYEVLFYHLIKFKVDCKTPILLNPIPDNYMFTPKKIKSLN